ncbi:MAG: single-stranded DNA-binding protein [Bacteroidales bacterium]|jgi:single-strand DNA-binding protein|nr:single-stranded DNA-binding protein [Bacteroidales bacterium]MDD3273608.1 single-stranded DNA-binding protein [Bacteroidales bacterium]MDD4057488.1 single-stranded DNA-binding protein [Bacteroidales bacterium]
MEKSINRVELRGHVGFDPRISSLEDGLRVMRLSLATNEAYKNRKGEWQEETVWHNIVAWTGRNMPDFSSIKKGSTLSVTGRIKPVNYQTKAGVERQTYEIVASTIKHHQPATIE